MGSFSQGWSPRHGHVQYNWMVLDNGDHWIDISRWQWPFSNWHNWMLIDWHIDIILVSYYGIIWYIYIENESNYILDWHSIDISFFFAGQIHHFQSSLLAIPGGNHGSSLHVFQVQPWLRKHDGCRWWYQVFGITERVLNICIIYHKCYAPTKPSIVSSL